jgi:hypothetical protein
MRDYFIIGLIAVALCGCTSAASRARNTYALLDDVSVPQEPNYDYKVVAVDGKPVERMHGYLATYVPYARLYGILCQKKWHGHLGCVFLLVKRPCHKIPYSSP